MFHFTKASLLHIEKMLHLRLALLKELGKVNSPEEEQLLALSTREYLQEAIPNNEFISYIAEKDGEPVSISGVVVFKRPPYLGNLKGMDAYILNMYTVPEDRGKGLAKKLLELCIEECKEIGVKRVWLHTTEAGEHLYKKMGFTPKENEMELYL